jgi:hypothetical protein
MQISNGKLSREVSTFSNHQTQKADISLRSNICNLKWKTQMENSNGKLSREVSIIVQTAMDIKNEYYPLV